MSTKRLYDDNSYESVRAQDERHYTKVDTDSESIFIEALIDLRMNHPEAYKKWADSRLNEVRPVDPKLQAEKDRINKEVEDLWKQMQEDQRKVK